MAPVLAVSFARVDFLNNIKQESSNWISWLFLELLWIHPGWFRYCLNTHSVSSTCNVYLIFLFHARRTKEDIKWTFHHYLRRGLGITRSAAEDWMSLLVVASVTLPLISQRSLIGSGCCANWLGNLKYNNKKIGKYAANAPPNFTVNSLIGLTGPAASADDFSFLKSK